MGGKRRYVGGESDCGCGFDVKFYFIFIFLVELINRIMGGIERQNLKSVKAVFSLIN